MKVPVRLSEAFGQPFEQHIAEFCTQQELIPPGEVLNSPRFLARSVVPHVTKLSQMFNREEKNQGEGLGPYWKKSSNPENLRLAYFLYFMPSNLFRVASVWAELARLGYRWNAGPRLRGIEFGAGPASGACGIAASEHFVQAGLPASGDWALIEQDKAMLGLGSDWAKSYFEFLKIGDWGTRPFHRTIELKRGFLPPTAPRFNLWVMSYYLNEIAENSEDIALLAEKLLESWDKHLDDEGMVVLVEPALKLQSRKLLELRRALLERMQAKDSPMQILLPCLGHQACGALAAPEDWCHEDVSWWRPPYFRTIDQMAELDRKSLPFSYLVLTKSRRAREEILPGLVGSPVRHRLVSPAHKEGQDWEFFLCGEDGKRRARYRPRGETDPAAELERGDILLGAQLRGDARATRAEKIAGVAGVAHTADVQEPDSVS
ncbi:MAG: small ribosomal subunit Rsm22 family protein [Bdellovibrionota bacterium]